MSSNTQNTPTEKMPADAKKLLLKDCKLHGPVEEDPGRLWYSHNGFGYSMGSPPCNGCARGESERARGIWMSGFGEECNVFYSVPKLAAENNS